MASGVTNWYSLSVRSQEPGLADGFSYNTSAWANNIILPAASCGSTPVNMATFSSSPVVRYTKRLLCAPQPTVVVEDIPAGMEVVGVEISVNREARSGDNSDTDVKDFGVFLIEANSSGSVLNTGTDQSTTVSWPNNVYGTSTYGSDSSLMGLSSVNPLTNKYLVGMECYVPLGGNYDVNAYVACVSYRFWYDVAVSGGTPVVNITYPVDLSTISENSFKATWGITDGVAPIKYTYQLDSFAPVETDVTYADLSGVADGDHTFSVFATDAINVVSDTDSVSFTISGGGITGFTVNFTATPGATQYQWSFGDGQTATGSSNQISHIYYAVGVYTVTVSASFDNCPSSVDTVVVDLSNFSTDFTVSASGRDITFTPSSTGGLTPTSPRYYLFDFGDNGTDGYYYLIGGTGSTVSDFHHVFGSNGSYDVDLITVDGGAVDGFTASAGQTIFNTAVNFVLGSAVVLMGADDDTLVLLEPSVDYDENESVGEGTGITLVSGASLNDKVYIGYVNVNSPVYSFTAMASHVVNADDSGALNITLSPSSGSYCYSPSATLGVYDFTATVANGVAPYTFTWLVDQDCEFDGTDSTGYLLKINGVISDCSSEIVHSGIATSSDSVDSVSYSPPSGTPGAAKTTHVNVVVQDSTPGTPLTGSTTITLNFNPLPTASASGTNHYAGDQYRFQSNNTTSTSPAIGMLYLTQQQPQLGTPSQSGVSYSWTPATYLDSPTSSQPKASLPYTPANVKQQGYTLTATNTSLPNCVNVSSTTVIKPTVALQSAVDDTGWVSKETCYRRVILTVSSFTPQSDNLAIIVERVVGGSGAVNVLGTAGTTLPKILDKAAYGPCDPYYTIGSTTGGICLLDPQHRTLAGGSNRIAMKMSNTQSIPFSIYVLDPICSTSAQISHDYRIRVIDIGNTLDSEVTESAVLAQSTAGGAILYSVAISNDSVVSFNHSGLNTCSVSVIIDPPSTSYTVQTPWSKTIALTAIPNGFTPTSYTWSFDKLSQFTGGLYTYSVTGGTTATPSVTYSCPVGSTPPATKTARVGLSCTGTVGGAPVTIIAGDVDYSITFAPSCSITCNNSITSDVASGPAPLTVNFSFNAVPSNCSSSTVNYTWDFGDGNTGSGSSVSHEYTTPGAYTVTVTATVAGQSPAVSCSRQTTITVTGTCSISSCTASASPNPANLNSTVTLGGNAVLTGNDCSSLTTLPWSWSCPGASPSSRSGVATVSGGTASISPQPTVTALTAGSYSWVLTWDTGGGSTCSRTVPVTINAGCSCSISWPSGRPLGSAWVSDSVAFNASVSSSDCGGTTPVWNWNFGDGQTLSGNYPSTTHTYSSSGTYSWSVYVSYNGQSVCQDSGTIGICGVSCNITNNPSSITQSVPVTFYSNATVGGGCTGTWTYSWTFGDGGTSTLQNPSHTYSAAGSYTVSLTATLNGHSTTCTKQVTVSVCAASCSWNTAVVAPKDGWWYQTTDAINAVTYTANTSGNQPCSGSWGYTWSFPCGSGATTGSSVVHDYTGCLGTKTASMGITFNGSTVCSNVSGSVTIVNFTATPTVGPSSIAPGGTVSFNGSYLINPLYSLPTPSYSWNFGDGTSSSLQNTSHTYSSPGTYTWTLNVQSSTMGTNNKILSASTTGTVTVVPPLTMVGAVLYCDCDCPVSTPRYYSIACADFDGGVAPYTLTCTVTGGVAGTLTTTGNGGTTHSCVDSSPGHSLTAMSLSTASGTGTYVIVVTDSVGQSVTTGTQSYNFGTHCNGSICC